MKTKITILILIALLAYLYFMAPKPDQNVGDGLDETETSQVGGEGIELCFAEIGLANERGFADEYILRMSLDGDKVRGELDLVPAEKDSKRGKFEGTVTPVDKVAMARTVNALWNTLQEGMSATEEIKIIFGEGIANVFFEGSATSGLELSDVACTDLDIMANVESYVRQNISTLSSVKPVLGGTWNVMGITVDVSKKTGTVNYEDGHIAEKRNFTFTTNDKQEVVDLKIE